MRVLDQYSASGISTSGRSSRPSAYVGWRKRCSGACDANGNLANSISFQNERLMNKSGLYMTELYTIVVAGCQISRLCRYPLACYNRVRAPLKCGKGATCAKKLPKPSSAGRFNTP